MDWPSWTSYLSPELGTVLPQLVSSILTNIGQTWSLSFKFHSIAWRSQPECYIQAASCLIFKIRFHIQQNYIRSSDTFQLKELLRYSLCWRRWYCPALQHYSVVSYITDLHSDNKDTVCQTLWGQNGPYCSKDLQERSSQTQLFVGLTSPLHLPHHYSVRLQ